MRKKNLKKAVALTISITMASMPSVNAAQMTQEGIESQNSTEDVWQESASNLTETENMAKVVVAEQETPAETAAEETATTEPEATVTEAATEAETVPEAATEVETAATESEEAATEAETAATESEEAATEAETAVTESEEAATEAETEAATEAETAAAEAEEAATEAETEVTESEGTAAEAETEEVTEVETEAVEEQLAMSVEAPDGGTGWVFDETNGKWCYYSDNVQYKNITQWIYDAESGNGFYYHFDQDGYMVTGWYSEDSNKYYYDEHGHAADGMVQVDGSTYYFSNAYMCYDYTYMDDNYIYYFGNDGRLQDKQELQENGWVTLSGRDYYMRDRELVRNELLTIEGSIYYVDYDGLKVTNESGRGVYDEESQKWYYYRFGKDGRAVIGWWIDPDYGTAYYYDEQGRGADGVVQVGEDTYYFSYACMYSNYTYVDDNYVYYFGEDGKLQDQQELPEQGWVTLNGSDYYVRDKEIVRDEFLTIDGSIYYVGPDGAKALNTHWAIYDEESQKTYYYRFGEDGRAVVGWWSDPDNDTVYYYDEQGREATGIVEIDGKKYYFGDNPWDNYMRTNEVVLRDGILYRFGEDGVCTEERDMNGQSGWVVIDGDDYYVQDGAFLKNTLFTSPLSGKVYYLDSTGKVCKGCEISIYDQEAEKDYYYYFDENGCMVTGWYELWEGDWFYYDENGHGASGLRQLNGAWYYFAYNGEMMTDYVRTEDGYLYYFGTDGKGTWQSLPNDGWVQFRGTYYYVRNREVVKNDWVQEGNFWYYLNWNGRMLSDTITDIYNEETDTWNYYRFDVNGHMVTGWYQDGSSWSYSYMNGICASGVTEVDGSWYFFDDGEMRTDYICTEDGYLYYFGADGKGIWKNLSNDGWVQFGENYYYVRNGKMVKNDWVQEGSFRYYLDRDGRMLSNTAEDIYNEETDTYEGHYRFDVNGHMVTGWYQDADGWYYYEPDGKAAYGLQTISGTRYYFEDEGKMQINRTILDADSDALYYLNAYGAAVPVRKNGWVENTWYVENGKVVTGWKWLSGKWYYFEPELYRSSEIYSDGKMYRTDSNGAMVTGWTRDNGVWYYAQNDGSLVRGDWLEQNGIWYWFDSYGEMATGVVQLEDGCRIFDHSGIYQGRISTEATQWVQAAGSWYYVKDGELVRNQSIVINGKQYLFLSNGKMATDRRRGSRYYGPDGAMVQNQWVQPYAGEWRYYGADGTAYGYRSSEWKEIGGVWYYFRDGKMVTEDVITDGYLYFMNSTGAYTGTKVALSEISEGWNLIAGYYYYRENGEFVEDGWKQVGGNWYYFEDGRMLFDELVWTDESSYYYMDKSGRMVRNAWCNDGTSYAGADGKLYEDGWKIIGGKQYLFEGTYCVTGRQLSEDRTKLYCFRSDRSLGETVTAWKNGWDLVDGSWYFTVDGKFATGVQTINGKVYYLSDYGMLTNAVTSEGVVDSEGVVSCTGWINGNYLQNREYLYGPYTIDGGQYYFSGGRSLSGLFEADGAFYYYDGNGKRTFQSLQNGWNQVLGHWYYVEDNCLVNGEKKINGVFYYFSNGRMLTDTLVSSSTVDEMFYVDANGHQVTNCWKWIGDAWYYFRADGRMIDEGTYLIDGAWYTFKYGHMI